MIETPTLAGVTAPLDKMARRFLVQTSGSVHTSSYGSPPCTLLAVSGGVPSGVAGLPLT